MPAKRGLGRVLLGALVLATALVLGAGCSRAPQPAARSVASLAPPTLATSADPVPTEEATTTSPSGSSPTGSASPSSVATATPTLASRPVTAAPSGPVDGPDGCPASVLTVAALRASGAAGHQYAFLQFTNRSAKTCSLTGFPGVQLLRSGAPLGQPAVRSSVAATTVRIKPGGSVTAQLVDDSTCNSANSDSVQVIAPNRTAKVVVPLSLRGCSLSIDPVTAG